MLQERTKKKSYGEGGSYIQVLKGISVGVNQGDMCVIQGTSGSGKSTLLNCIGGIIGMKRRYRQQNWRTYKMQKVLQKRILRDLKKNIARYLALGFLIILSMYMVVSMISFPFWMYPAIFAVVLVLYFIINHLLVRKIRKMAPTEVLKNRE